VTRPITVVGAGPAGLIAAETLATAGLRVTVYEHKRSAGRKFLLAGRGGLNITHAEPLDDLLNRYGSGREFLEPAIRAFSPQDLRDWCTLHGEPTFVGTSDRVFPQSFRATPLLHSWLSRLADLGVRIETGHRWVGWSESGDPQFIIDGKTEKVTATSDATVFALGGASWPRVGSDGGWTKTFEAAGIEVTALVASNCGVTVAWSDVVRSRFAGEPIKNAVFGVGGQTSRGDAIVAESGLEGGPIYALGPELRRAFDARSSVVMVLDLHPDISEQALTKRLSKRRPKASVTSWLNSAGVSPVAVALCREVTGNQLPDDPATLAHLLKALPIEIDGLSPIERAISTAGGIRRDQVNEGFMLTNLPGTFVAGEMLDWDAPTGGYLLQACFSTGVAAADGVLTWLDNKPSN
jgi:uncharacterized flavoprotein (TIGR03862 family)